MGSRKKNKPSIKLNYQVLIQPFGFDGTMRVVLHVFDFKNHRKTTYDKKRGKQIWNYPHNESLSVAVPSERTSHPTLIKFMRKIYNT